MSDAPTPPPEPAAAARPAPDAQPAKADQTAPDARPAVADAPPLRLVRGRATPEELAAVVAVLAAAGAAADADADTSPPAPLSAWADRARLVRAPVSVGPSGWRASAFPR